jgi:hypothetical protein
LPGIEEQFIGNSLLCALLWVISTVEGVMLRLMLIHGLVAGLFEDVIPGAAATLILVFIGVVIWGVRQNFLRPEQHQIVEYGHLIVVSLGIVAVVVAFLITMLFSADLFQKTTQVLAILTALFGVIGTLVGTYFGVKASSDARQGAQELVASSSDTTPPQVSSTDPQDKAVDVSPEIHPTATFSKPMDSVSINPDTFKVLRQDALPDPVSARVPDGVVYEEAAGIATFIPAAHLESGRTYTAIITASVKDQAGNTLAQDHTWHFTVGLRGS